MRISIIYATKTNHTKKLAEAIGSQIEVVPQNISESPVIENVDILFIGSGIYAGKVSPKLESFLNSIDKANVKQAVLFSSCTSGEDQTQVLRKLLVQKGISVAEKTFVCKGKFLFFSRKHPDKTDLQNVKEFAIHIVNDLQVKP